MTSASGDASAEAAREAHNLAPQRSRAERETRKMTVLWLAGQDPDTLAPGPKKVVLLRWIAAELAVQVDAKARGVQLQRRNALDDAQLVFEGPEYVMQVEAAAAAAAAAQAEAAKKQAEADTAAAATAAQAAAKAQAEAAQAERDAAEEHARVEASSSPVDDPMETYPRGVSSPAVASPSMPSPALVDGPTVDGLTVEQLDQLALVLRADATWRRTRRAASWSRGCRR